MPRIKKCAICKKELVPSKYTTIQKYCTYKCAQTGAKKLAKKRRKVKSKTAGQTTLDDKWSRLIKERDSYTCRVPGCGKTTYLNSHHIYSRSNRATRWYMPNGITLCSGHHVLKHDFSAHKTPVEFIEWLREEFGNEYMDDLTRQAKSVDKETNEYWIDYLNSFEEV